LSENLKGREHAEDLDVDGRIILQWILEKQSGRLQTGFNSEDRGSTVL
jgi:hypothetical protein